MKAWSYGWVWSWDEHAMDPTSESIMNRAHYPDAHDSRGFHWITVYSYGPEGVEDEVCTIPLYTSYDKWRELIQDREEKAQMIVDALQHDMESAGG
jgi:hypothetical protein